MADGNAGGVDAGIRDRIAGILERLREKLSGDVLAFQYLAGGRDGAGDGGPAEFRLEQLYCDKSFELWERLFAADTGNWAACHHLAIMHHAKAFDLEHSGQLQDAHHHWVKAQEYWKALAGSESFFPTLHAMLKTLRGYRDSKHEKLLEGVAPKLGENILRVHWRLAELYTDAREPKSAGYHLLAIKRSPFDCSAEIYAKVYEALFGRRVRNRMAIVKQHSAAAHLQAQRPELDELAAKIRAHYPAGADTFQMGRDLLWMEVWHFRIDFNAFLSKVQETDRELTQKRRQMKVLEAEITASRAKHDTQGLNDAEIDRHNEKVRNHVQLLSDFNGLLEDLKGRYKTFVPRAEKIERQLREVTIVKDYQGLGPAEVDLRDMILDCRLQGAESWDAYKALEHVYDRISLILNRRAPEYHAGSGEEVLADSGSGDFELWPWSICANKQNPYAGTCFLLFGVEPPEIQEGADLEAVVMRVQRRRQAAAARAQHNRLVVMNRRVSKADLNDALNQAKKPEDMLRHLAFQHQVHRADASEEEAELAALPLGAAVDVAIAPTPAILEFLPEPKISTKEQASRANALDDPPAGMPEQFIEWPA
jgi:hypothetical protein